MCRDTRPVSKKGTDMPKKTVLRPWTATDVYKLKGLAKKKVGVEKIARAFKSIEANDPCNRKQKPFARRLTGYAGLIPALLRPLRSC
jgi:hypothetical protein